MPSAARATSPATLPPAGLDGLDPSWSRLVTVPAGGAERVERTWHLLDNAASLEALGAEPVGTVLCVHGNPTWSYLWRRLVAQATEAAASGRPAWRVVAVDQLDMGFSERTGVERGLPQRVADLAALTTELGLEGPVVTLGHDWGGVVSMGWAVDHPGQLAAVTMLNTAIHQPADEPIPAPLRLTLARGVLGRATVATTGFIDVTLGLAHPRLRDTVRTGYRAPYLSAARRGGVGGFVADIPVDQQHPSRAELDRIAASLRDLAVPSLMLWGPRDPIFGDRYLDDLADRLPHADVHRFEGAGHMIAEDVDYAAAVLTWLGDRFPEGPTRASSAGDRRAASTGGGAAATTTASMATDPRGTAATTAEEAPGTVQDRPLWSYLDSLADSPEAALIEMVPHGAARGSGPRRVSWQLLSRRVHEIALGLRKHGVRPGDRVSLLVQPGADLTAVLYACVRIGAVVVVADAGLGVRGLTRAVRGAWPDHVIGQLPGLTAARALGWPGRVVSTQRLSPVLARSLGVETSLPEIAALGRRAHDAMAELPEPPVAEAPAAILFTSGSTGPAKGVVYRHGQLTALRDALADRYGVGPGTGLVAGFAPFALLGPALGATSVTPDMDVTSPRTLTARAVAAAAEAVDATVVFLSPAALTNVVATADELDDAGRRALAGVSTFLSAGAPVSATLLAAAGDLMPGAVPHTPYGMTEGLLMTDVTLDEVREAASDPSANGVCVGRPAPTVQVRVAPLDEAGRASDAFSDAVGVTGEIVVSAPHLKHGYDRLWLTDRASVRGVGDTTGVGGAAAGTDASSAGSSGRWHRTGDVGHVDDQGRLWVEGRLPHVVTTASGPLTPVAAEQAVESLAGVARAAVVGVGPAGTQQVGVVCEGSPAVRRPGLAAADLAADVRAAVLDAVGHRVAAVLVVPELPTDVRHNSKIDRARLSAWATSVLSGGRMRRP
ncbi:alpha/beta fold hydrolase [Frigoribacterium sp. CFBP 8766]|uniref:alpha/beta fold hydrolase n=1 Tax=Frigoribacterium sp. CFBP 8766 TaxID=2775273 RepID=UPI00177B5CC1|nr:alpha/beta fold hydrolase [Frigoribacterium sp. CFBP 8766]MBD8583526.1 alpha/beta fold hydrolase [Frigoribacterium sp. CFBP 8766]